MSQTLGTDATSMLQLMAVSLILLMLMLCNCCCRKRGSSGRASGKPQAYRQVSLNERASFDMADDEEGESMINPFAEEDGD